MKLGLLTFLTVMMMTVNCSAQVVFRLDHLHYFYQYPDSFPSESVEMVNGTPNGHAQTFNSDGNLQEDKWLSQGFLIGTYRRYNTDGSLGWVVELQDYTPPTFEKYLLYRPQQPLVARWPFANEIGIRDGKATEYFSTGEIRTQTEWVNGERNGPYQYWFRSRDRSKIYLYNKGQHLYDRPEGIWEYFFPNGVCSEKISYHQGLYHGCQWNYDTLGRLQSLAHFTNGNRDSTETTYFPSGKVSRRQIWKANGKDYLDESYFQNGQIKSRGLRKNEIKVDEWLAYDSLGRPESVGRFLHGQKHGPWKHFDIMGKTDVEAVFEEGVLMELHHKEKTISILPGSDVLLSEAEKIVFQNFPIDELPSPEIGEVDEIEQNYESMEVIPGPHSPLDQDWLPKKYNAAHPLSGRLVLKLNGTIDQLQLFTPMPESERQMWIQKLTQLKWRPAVHGDYMNTLATRIDFSIFHEN